MAVSTKQPQTPDQRPPASKLATWARQFGAALGRPIISVILAFIAGAIVIIITWPNKQVDPFTNVFNAYTTLFTGSFGTPTNFSDTLVRVTPLIFTSLSVAIAFRAGLFNIGAAGQLAVGAMAADMIGLTYSSWPSWILIPTMLLASMLAGAIWGGIVGFLKAWRGAHEVVTTIMLNWIAFWGTDYLINSPPFTAPFGVTQTIALSPQAQLPSLALLYNQTLGNVLPRLGPFALFSYKVDVSIFLALIAVVIYWFIISRTTFGYEIRVIGQNPKAARYAGIPTKRNIFLVMAIAGAFAGLAGSTHLMGQPGYELSATAFSSDPTGFDAIAVALLGRTTAIGILLASLFFGGLRSGSTAMQAIAHVDPNLVLIIEALVLFFIAAEFLPVIQRSLPKGIWFSRRPAVVPAPAGTTTVAVPENGNGNVEKGVEISNLDKEE
ncbi:MAG TPA: ABC transporter permease [Ktedonobacteraceae bacterium]|nr:ABC transporter permease [Ktedonobacteraceae bacterium]